MCETHENDRQGRPDADAPMACLQKFVDFSAALFSRQHFFSARKDGGGGDWLRGLFAERKRDLCAQRLSGRAAGQAAPAQKEPPGRGGADFRKGGADDGVGAGGALGGDIAGRARDDRAVQGGGGHAGGVSADERVLHGLWAEARADSGRLHRRAGLCDADSVRLVSDGHTGFELAAADGDGGLVLHVLRQAPQRAARAGAEQRAPRALALYAGVSDAEHQHVSDADDRVLRALERGRTDGAALCAGARGVEPAAGDPDSAVLSLRYRHPAGRRPGGDHPA